MDKTKYIFVTGGVVSGLGKGITAASLGRILIGRGLKVTIQKLDPYINVDPGTMSPYEHGEVFVTEDGAETDLDIGHYERFLGQNFNAKNNYTTGKIYSSVINKERKGEYLGKTVQVIPHITNEIVAAMKSVADDNDIVIIEVGGTVGDIEGMVYLEAIRQFRKELGAKNSLSVHVTLVPYLPSSGEIKTKPTQSSVRELNQLGIFPDILVCRTSAGIVLDESVRAKIAMFCNLDSHACVIHNYDCNTIYEVPLLLKEQKFDDIVLAKLGITARQDDLLDWRKIIDSDFSKSKSKTISIVGKYTNVPDAYLSIIEAIKHAGWKNKINLNIKLVDSELIEKEGAKKILEGTDAVVVPGGFGYRGIEGKILTAQYARENKIPYLGICVGMQIAVIEFARNVAKMVKANSTEFDLKTPYPVIDIMNEQKNVTEKGGTMRLGLYECKLAKGSRSADIYKTSAVKERHRHRYELNNRFKADLEKAGLVIAGEYNGLTEIIEIKDHPYFIAVQFHPEFLSKPYRPHPLFLGLTDQLR